MESNDQAEAQVGDETDERSDMQTSISDSLSHQGTAAKLQRRSYPALWKTLWITGNRGDCARNL